MPLFGQVWLWSLLAFLLGALLCWLLVAFPARRRVSELQARLASMSASRLAEAHRGAEADRKRREARATADRVDEDFSAPALAPRFADEYPRPGAPAPDAGSLTRAYAMPGAMPPGRTEEVEAAERGMLRMSAEAAAGPTAPHPSGIGALDHGSPGPYAPPEPPRMDAAETELADSGRAEATRYLSSVSGPLPPAPPVRPHPPVEAPPEPDGGRDWFAAEAEDEPPGQDQRLVDDEEAADHTGGTIFTERTAPIPVDLIRRLDAEADVREREAEERERQAAEERERQAAEERERQAAEERRAAEERAAEWERQAAQRRAEELRAAEEREAHRRQDALVDDLPDEETGDPRDTAVAGTAPAMASMDPRTEVVAPVGKPEETGAHARPEAPAEPEPAPAPTLPKRPERAQRKPVEAKLAHGITVAPEHTQSALPKRVPSKPVHRHPFGVKTTSPATAPATTAEGDERIRSLFEPIVPAEDDGEPSLPPPNRMHTEHRAGPGPFGPGSAMPLPGGAAPSPDFKIKASVTALRYCTPESPQFGRTVAEVWFRSAADAERVGFRPVG